MLKDHVDEYEYKFNIMRNKNKKTNIIILKSKFDRFEKHSRSSFAFTSRVKYEIYKQLSATIGALQVLLIYKLADVWSIWYNAPIQLTNKSVRYFTISLVEASRDIDIINRISYFRNSRTQGYHSYHSCNALFEDTLITFLLLLLLLLLFIIHYE